MIKKMSYFVLLLSVGIIFSGCISLGTYNEKMRACQKTQQERDYYQSKLAEFRDKNRGLEKTLSDQEMTKDLLKQEIDEKDKKMKETRGTYEDLIAELKDYIADGDVGVNEGEEGLTISMGNKVLFRSGKSSLQPKGKKILKSVSNVLVKVQDRRIRVEGHTDNVPISPRIKNRYPSNWELSAFRAAAVVRYLEEVGNVDPANLILAARGDKDPVADNSSEAGRRLNRRVEIELVK